MTGQNFSGAAGHLQVLFGNTPATSVTVIDDAHVTAVAPTGSGTVDVRVQSGVSDPNDPSNIKSPIFGYGDLRGVDGRPLHLRRGCGRGGAYAQRWFDQRDRRAEPATAIRSCWHRSPRRTSRSRSAQQPIDRDSHDADVHARQLEHGPDSHRRRRRRHVVEGNHTGTITHQVTSADGNYNGRTVSSVTVQITDNDTPANTAAGGSRRQLHDEPRGTP